MTVYLFLLILFSGCHQEKLTTVSLAMQPDEAKNLSKAAFLDFGGALKGELTAAMKDGGPTAAVEVCHRRAPQIAESVSEMWRFSVGRSSHKLRNPENAPLESVKKYLAEYSEKKAADAPVEVADVGQEWIVISPIEAQPLCLTCHGDPKTFDPNLKQALAERYPEDQATGFEAGDLRGVFWAKIPKDYQPVSGVVPISDSSPRKIKTH
jgi:Protein of unknown function (DUF3365)